MKKILNKLPFLNKAPVVSVLRLDGAIMASSGRGNKGLNIRKMAPLIKAAFAPKRLKAVVLLINSPGGSPVQSSLIHKNIRSLAQEKNIPVIAVVEDVAASGGYWLALAADEIFADESSVIGSIGVVYAGFGFEEMIGKLGIDRRVYTTGENKAMLDPFQPENEDHVSRLKQLQDDIFVRFKDLVRERRGERLKETDDLFSGAFWVAPKALERGLIDGYGDVRGLVRERFGKETRIRMLEGRQGWLDRKLGLFMGALSGHIEERLLWSRFGL